MPVDLGPRTHVVWELQPAQYAPEVAPRYVLAVTFNDRGDDISIAEFECGDDGQWHVVRDESREIIMDFETFSKIAALVAAYRAKQGA